MAKDPMAKKKLIKWGIISAGTLVVLIAAACICFMGSVTSVSLDNPSLDMKVGDTVKLSASVTRFLRGTQNETVKWSYDDKIVKVGEDGTVTAVGEGDTKIGAQVGSSNSFAYCNIHSEHPTVTIGGKTHKINETSLDLSNCNISDISPLSQFSSLTTLNLSDNPVSDIGALAPLTALESINISNTNVTDISALSSLKNLKTLDITGAGVKDISVIGTGVYIKMGQKEDSLTLGYCGTHSYNQSDFGLMLGNRKVDWKSNCSLVPSYQNGNITITNIQEYISSNTIWANVIGTVENSDINLKYEITISSTAYSYIWANKSVSLKNCKVYTMLLKPEIKNCYGFTVDVSSDSSKGNPYKTNWYVMVKSTKWQAVKSFNFKNGASQTLNIVLDKPMDISAIVIVPNGRKLRSYCEWECYISLSELSFAPNK